MALNWFLTLRNLSKTDATAAALMEQLKTAETDDEKNTAKENAQAYLQKIQSNENSKSESTDLPETNPVVAEETGTDDREVCDETSSEGNSEDGSECEEESPCEERKEDKKITDLSQPAFNPRLARYGITREEELFLHGVFVRKMSREDKILMRRSIYQKKNVMAAKIQAIFKAKRLEQKNKEAKDPEIQKYHQERKYVSAIVDALEQHKNLAYIFNGSSIEGLTVEIFRELIKKPGNVNAFNQVNPNFMENFYKMYGK